MKKNMIKLMLLATVMVVSSTAFAGNKHNDKKYQPRHKQFVYGKVLDVTPVYREIKINKPNFDRSLNIKDWSNKLL